MSRNLYLISILYVLIHFVANAQTKNTLNGYVKDKSNGEALIGATVFIKELKIGTATNVYGFYSITVPAGNYTLDFSYVGYTSIQQPLDLSNSIRLDIELSPAAQQLQEVVVTDEEEERKAINKEMSTNKLDIGTIKKIPAFLGEVDVIKSLQMLPGVSTVGDGASGFNVRGGSVGQNLVLLDEAPVYNASHMLGFFSVFNPDAVKDVKLYKVAIPAKYGGRISSILDVLMKDGNSKNWEVSGGVGTIFSRVAVEGPLIKDKASFIIAARRSYIDVLALPFVQSLQNGGALNFYDLTLKTNYNLNQKNKFYLSGYFGRDNFLFSKNQGFSWGNATGTMRWNHLFNDRLFMNQTLEFSNYDYHLQFGNDEQNRFVWSSAINNYIFKPDFSYFINTNSELNFGGEVIYYTFEPANASGITNGTPVNVSLEKKYNLEASLYLGHSLRLNSVLSVDYGLRYSNFTLYGPGTQYLYNDTVPGIRKTVIGSKYYKNGG